MKLFFTILILTVSMLIVTEINADAKLHGNMQIGYIQEIDSFEAEINVQYLPVSWLTFYVGINVLMEYYRSEHLPIAFMPYRDTYIIGATVDITQHIYVDLYHHCTHPVFSSFDQFYDRFNGGNKTRISTGIKW